MSWLKSMMEKEPPEPENPIGTVVIGNIEPDMHDTAKEAVRRSLKRAGFKTIDVGKSVAPQVFIDKAKETNADIIALSVNTVPAKNNLEKEPPEPENPIGTVVIGNIEPDMHDTAKEAVRRSLKRAGFKTIDVGKSVAPQVFIDKAKETNADIIALSVNTVPAKNNLAKLDEALKAAGLKDKVMLIMGGAAIKKEDATAMGALFGKNKEEGVEIAKKAMAGKKK